MVFAFGFRLSAFGCLWPWAVFTCSGIYNKISAYEQQISTPPAIDIAGNGPGGYQHSVFYCPLLFPTGNADRGLRGVYLFWCLPQCGLAGSSLIGQCIP